MIKQNNLLELVNFTKSLKLLFVEDSKEVREQTTKFFENFFTDITVCENGQEGFNTFKEKSFDLIITDLNMPVMSGQNMIKNIRNLDKNIPILVLSAHNEKNFIDDAEEQNIAGYIIKPIKMEDYVQMLTKIKTDNEK